MCLQEVSLFSPEMKESSLPIYQADGQVRHGFPPITFRYECPSRSTESNVICRPGEDPAQTYPDARSVAAYFDHWIKVWQARSGQNGTMREIRWKIEHFCSIYWISAGSIRTAAEASWGGPSDSRRRVIVFAPESLMAMGRGSSREVKAAVR